MSMDDTHALAAAIITGSEIELKTPEKTLTAQIIFATISCDHRTGSFSGSVNFLVEGENRVRIEAFYNMWVCGWEPVRPNHYLSYLSGTNQQELLKENDNVKSNL